MSKIKRAGNFDKVRSLNPLVFLAVMLCARGALSQAKPEEAYFSRVNTFGVFGAYSNDSSHILMGIADNRRLLEFGGAYSRRLLQNRVVNWQYNVELLPVALEGDPLLHSVITYILPDPSPPLRSTYAQAAPCRAGSGTVSFMASGRRYEYTYVDTCSRQWTIGEAMSPVGFQWNFLPRRRLQPVIVGHGGYMYSTHSIPVEDAGSFNFTFDLGAGLELYRSRHSSIRADYRYHHISNHYTANANPGIDNGVFQVTYSFGR